MHHPGTYELATKVGWSLSLPVTGLGGACKFEGDYKFTEENYYFKIVFDDATYPETNTDTIPLRPLFKQRLVNHHVWSNLI